MPIDLAEPAIILEASSISWAFKSAIFCLAISWSCFFVIEATIFLPGSWDPLFNFTASFIKWEAGGDLIIKSVKNYNKNWISKTKNVRLKLSNQYSVKKELNSIKFLEKKIKKLFWKSIVKLITDPYKSCTFA